MSKIEIREAWKKNYFSGTLEFAGFEVETVSTECISAEELLALVSSRWFDIPLKKREEFKLHIQRLELGIETPAVRTIDPDKLIE